MNRSNARRASFGGMMLAGVLVICSAAYACTSIRGTMSITSGTTTSAVTANVNGAHAYCSVTGGARGGSGDQITVEVAPYVNTGPADPCPSSGLRPSADAPEGQTYEPCTSDGVTDCINTNDGLLRRQGAGAGTYEVLLVTGAAFDVSGSSRGPVKTTPTYTHMIGDNAGCVEGSRDYLLGTMTVDQDGTGSWTGTLPSGMTKSAPSESAGVCVFKNAGYSGPPVGSPLIFQDDSDIQSIMAPLTLI